MMEVGFKRVENSDVDYVSCPFYLVEISSCHPLRNTQFLTERPVALQRICLVPCSPHAIFRNAVSVDRPSTPVALSHTTMQ